MRTFIERLGRRMLRGPLEEREVDLFRGITTSLVANGGTYEEAVGLVLEAMLQSPRFIYRMENQQAGGRISDAEQSVRLSFLLWGAPPDEALNAAADKGQLGNASQLRAQVERMLKDPRAVERSMQFASEWLNLGYLANLRPDKQHFPNWNPALAGDMRTETIAFFKEIVWKQNRPLSDLLNAQFTHLTPGLAKHYGLPTIAEGEGPQRYDLTKVPARGGLLTQGSMLIGNGTGSAPHPIYRAVWLCEAILGDDVADPPADVPALSDSAGESAEKALTIKDLLAKHRQKESCRDCHARLDPWGIPFEHYNAIGKYQPLVPKEGVRVSGFNLQTHGDLAGYTDYLKTLNTERVDATARVPRGPEVNGMADLKAYLQKDRRDEIAENLLRRLLSYSLGRDLTPRDRFAVDAMLQESATHEHRLLDMIVTICQSPLFKGVERK